MAEYVIDLHTGGRSMGFLPCAHMHLVPDLQQRARMMRATEAFLTEVTFLYADVAGAGLLPSEAERQGKIVITTELGGGEAVPASIHRLCQSGLTNVLRHCGVLAWQGAFASRGRPAASPLGAGTGPGRLPLCPREWVIRKLRRARRSS